MMIWRQISKIMEVGVQIQTDVNSIMIGTFLKKGLEKKEETDSIEDENQDH